MKLSTSWRAGMLSFLFGAAVCLAWTIYELTSKPDGGAFLIALGFTAFFGLFAVIDWVMLRRSREAERSRR